MIDLDDDLNIDAVEQFWKKDVPENHVVLRLIRMVRERDAEIERLKEDLENSKVFDSVFGDKKGSLKKLEQDSHEAMRKAWIEYPSQDNEGFRPDRGGFKCGWHAAIDWVKETLKGGA